MKKTIVNKCKKKSRTQNQSGGRKRRKSLKKKKTNKRKWSMKYKKSINCKKPKGFSQKQYCKFGRKKKGGGDNWRSYGEDDLINIINNETTTPVQLKSIINQLNKFENGNLTETTKPGYMALIRYTLLNPLDNIYKGFETRALNLINESLTGTHIVGVDYNIEDFYQQFEPTSQNDPDDNDNELGPPPPLQPLVRQRAYIRDYTNRGQ
tara:strand:- start:1428 stop:2051 length:624 start_codon:yes stop_codon:yes gene_type:complete